MINVSVRAARILFLNSNCVWESGSNDGIDIDFQDQVVYVLQKINFDIPVVSAGAFHSLL